MQTIGSTAVELESFALAYTPSPPKKNVIDHVKIKTLEQSFGVKTDWVKSQLRAFKIWNNNL
jgi:hypothetical protein